MSKSIIKKFIIGFVFFIAALLILQSVYYVNIHFEKITNHEKVTKYVNTDLMFSWDTMDEELAEIHNWIDTKHFYNEDLGRLYERASLIYMQKGETMSYYRYLGYALYYLEKSQEKDYTVNVYLDMANFFLNNFARDSAEEMVTKAEAIKPFDEIENIQIKSYAYRMKGIIAIQHHDYNTAEQHLLASQRFLRDSHTGVFEEAYEAINDVWLAQVYVESGRLAKCQEKLAKWEGHEMFTTDVYRQIMLRDLIIPYYQTKVYAQCYESIRERNNPSEEEIAARSQAVIDCLDEFMDLCEENGYEKTELNTLLKIQKEYPTKDEETRSQLYLILNNLYTKLFNTQNITYANIIDNMVEDSKAEMHQNQIIHSQRVRRMELIIAIILLVMILFLIFIMLLINNRYDGLTKLFTRKVFNRDIIKIKNSKSPYGIIMLDIDNFKHVNDTYGHLNGDIVLQRLGQLIQKELTADIQGYRYGGEEFILLLNKNALVYMPKIAERLRIYMEQQGWEFDPEVVITLSIGTAKGQGNDEVVRLADDNLYYSKAHGKNMVKNE